MKTAFLILGFVVVLLSEGCAQYAPVRASGDGNYLVTGISNKSANTAAAAARYSARNHCETYGLRWESVNESGLTNANAEHHHTLVFTCTQPIQTSNQTPVVLWDRPSIHLQHASGYLHKEGLERQGRDESSAGSRGWERRSDTGRENSGTPPSKRQNESGNNNENNGYPDKKSQLKAPEDEKCATDHNCSRGMWCKKKPYNVKGVCGVVVTATGHPLALEPRMNSQGVTNKFQCRTNRDCIQGFVCEEEYKVCEKGW